MLTNFNDTIHRILKHMVKHPEDVSLLKKYTSALDLSGKSKEIAAALLTEINVIDKITANE